MINVNREQFKVMCNQAFDYQFHIIRGKSSNMEIGYSLSVMLYDENDEPEKLLLLVGDNKPNQYSKSFIFYDFDVLNDFLATIDKKSTFSHSYSFDLDC